MLRYVFVLLMAFGSSGAFSHQLLPTYPTFQRSFVDGVFGTRLEMFNKRADVEFYEIGVFDKDWNPISFATENKILNLKYLETKSFNVYVRENDVKRAVYICTESKIKRHNTQITLISSKICSKVK